MRNKFRFLLLSATALVLCACGGGGSGASAPSAMTISGAVVKGPMAMAQVKAYKTTSAGVQGELLGSATTDANGGYTISMGSYTGVVLLTSTATADTTMWDEATGVSIAPPVGYSLRASLAVGGTGAMTAQINPFTEAATAAAVKAGGLTKANVDQANADMAAVLTFNPLDTVAQFDATSHVAKNAAAAALTAVSNMALSGALNCGVGGQAAKVSCTTAAMASSGMGDAAIKSALQTHITSVTGSLGLPTLTLQNPSGTVVSDATPLDQTKAFFTTLRSNAKALSGTEFSLKSELEAANSDLKDRTVPLAENNLWVVWLAADAAQLWNDSVLDASKPFVAGKDFYRNSFNSADFYGISQAFGRCEITTDAAGAIRAESKDQAKYMSCSTYAYRNIFANGGLNSFVDSTDADGYVTTCTKPGDICGTHWDTVLTMSPATVDATFSVVTATRKRVLTLKASALPSICSDSFRDPMWACPVDTFNYADTLYGAAASSSSGGNQATLVTTSDSTGAITGAELIGELAPAFVVDSKPIYSWIPPVYSFKPNKSVTVLGDKQNIRLKAALTTVNSVSKLAVTAYMDVVVNGAVDSRVELLDGSYLQAKAIAPGVYTGTDGSEELFLKLRGGTSATTLDGSITVSTPSGGASNKYYQPTLVSFNGKFSRNNVALFNGTLSTEILNYKLYDASQPASANNQRKNKLDFTGSVSIPNRPNMALALSMVETISSPPCSNGICTNTNASYALTGQYQQGLLTVNLEGAGSGSANTVTLTSTTGVKLVADSSAATYPLTKNGQTMGVYDPKKMQVNYTDGSYEQF